jgi:hypothetical protein
VAIK